MLSGVHVCTMPFSVMKNLCENTLTALGTAQFKEHTALMTMRVADLIRPENPVCKGSETLTAAMVKMTESRLGAVTLGATQTVGSAASIVVSTPIAVFDPVTRKNYDDQWRRLGNSVEDTTTTAVGQ